MKIKEIKEIYNQIHDVQSQIKYFYTGSTNKSIVMRIEDLYALTKKLFSYLPKEIQTTYGFDQWQLYPDDMEYEVALEKYKKLKILK